MNKGFVLFGSLFIVFSIFLSFGYSEEDIGKIDYDNLEESISSIEDELDKAYSDSDESLDEFYWNLEKNLDEEGKAVLDLWMSRQTGLDYEKRIEYGQNASNYFRGKAKEEDNDFLRKAGYYQLAADSLLKPAEDVKEGYTIEDYEEERNSYLVDSYYYLSKYYDSQESSAESYYAKRELYEKLESLPEGAEGKESGMSIEKVKEEIINSLYSGGEFSGEIFSWVMRDTVDAINLGKSISGKMYENFAFYRTIEDWFDNLVSPIYEEFFGGTGFGKFLTGNFENLICAHFLKIHGETPVLATEDGKLGSFVAGQRQTITNPDGSVKYLYKVTFKIDPAFDSNTKETNLSMQVYDSKNDEYYLHLDFDKTPKDPYVVLDGKDLIYTPKNQPLAWYSDIKFEKVCVEFYNVDAFTSDFKYLLKGNDNKICSDITEVEPKYIEEEQSYHDSSGTSGGESGGEEEYKWAN